MGQIVRATSGNLTLLGLWYTTGFGVRSQRLIGPGPRWVGPGYAWNAYGWDLQG